MSPPTGEPDAGDPPVRFGGRGDVVPSHVLPTPIDLVEIAKPLHGLMCDRVRKSHVVPTDDTAMPLLGPGKTRKARTWS